MKKGPTPCPTPTIIHQFELHGACTGMLEFQSFRLLLIIHVHEVNQQVMCFLVVCVWPITSVQHFYYKQ